MKRVILHVDMNCFFASVELLHRPEYRGRPVAVGGSETERRGIILTASYDAKARGVRTAMTLRDAYERCPELTVFPPDYARYIRFSRMARHIYEDYTDQVENFGIDEAWLDLTGRACLLHQTPLEVAEELRKRVKAELGITVSIGVSDNKVFAKLGSDYKKPDACTVIDSENFKRVAWPLPVESLLLIGPATKRKLNAHGIFTIGDLAGGEPEYLTALLGKNGALLYGFANGLDRTPVRKLGVERAIQSIGNGTTVPRDLETCRDAQIILTMLSESVAQRLREHGFAAGTVTLGIRTFQLESSEHQMKLPRPSSLSTDLCAGAMHLLREVCAEEDGERLKIPLRSVTVTASDLMPESEIVQTSVFENTEHLLRMERLERTMDDLRRRFGHHCIKRAVTVSDDSLGYINAREEHTVHPVGFFGS